MSISERDKKIIIIFIGVLIFALVYYFPVRGYHEDSEKISAENVTLTAKLSELEAKVAREAEIKAETTNYEAETMTMAAKFPSYLKVENEIMDIVGLENELKVDVPLLTVNDPVEVTKNDDEQAKAEPAPVVDSEEAPEAPATEEVATAPEASNKYKLFGRSVNINYLGGYDSMKKFIDKIAKSSDKKSITTVSLTFDDKTGNLDGSIVYDSYFLLGSDRPYEEIVTKTIKHGTKNIFGTVDASKINKGDGTSE